VSKLVNAVWLWITHDRELNPISYELFSTKKNALETRGEPDFYDTLLSLNIDDSIPQSKCEHIEQSLFWVCNKCGEKHPLDKKLGEKLMVQNHEI